MALTSRERAELPQPKQPNYREMTSPERTKIWIEPMPKTNRKVAVVYYLSRNGLLEHPHFIEVPLSSPNGLYLKDFINRLNFLRGKSIAAMYSWSSKRSYKNGFVWQDLFESDFIYPTHGQEYVLKGSELLEPSRSQKDVSICSQKPMELLKLIDGVDFADGSRRVVDLSEYKVYKAELTAEISDASTQTDDQSPRQRRSEEDEDHKAELSGGEISPPPHSSSSTETLEPVAKEENHAIDGEDARISDRTARNHPSGRIRASAVLRQLISCGSMSGREEHGVSMISRLAVAIPSGAQNQVVSRDAEELGDKYCFSRRLLDSKEKDDECGRRESLDLRGRSSSFSLIRS
ncbi:hypothetical protein MRB53_029337 [Persea americana]|uniref:Uncharacterized protein n=1 Tax=Persea americana TaxID=3435 RepID=A0ACC2KIG7_PERAE|nr:hypothetical protein MRB53_029337 [Persea americana]